MKNKGLIITLIVLLSIIVILLITFLVAYLGRNINFRNGIFSIGYKSSNVIFDKTYEMEDIKNIEIIQDAGDIVFKETSNDYIQVVLYGEDTNDAYVNLNENKLTIDYTHKRKFALFSFGVSKNDIIIYIPSNYSNEIKISNDYGNCEITDLENATLDIDCDAGNVELGKIKNVKIKCDYGNIEINEILNKCDIKSDCGNIEIDKISIQEDSSIKSDLGNVDIREVNDICIDANVDLGKANINENNRNGNVTLKINCDVRKYNNRKINILVLSRNLKYNSCFYTLLIVENIKSTLK